MDAARLLATESAVDDQRGHCHEVAEFQDVGVDAVSPVELAHFPVEVPEAETGPEEPFVRADDGDVVPHGAADLVPVVVDVDQFIGRGGIPVFPVGDRGGGSVLPGREVVKDFREGPAGHDVSFQETVGGETVGPVQSRTGHLADGKQTTNGGGAVRCGNHAAALIVSSGHDRDGGRFGIVTELKESLVDERESLCHETLRLVGDIEVDAMSPGLLDLGIDCAGDNIAGSERAALIVVPGEVLTILVEQHCAFSTQCL